MTHCIVVVREHYPVMGDIPLFGRQAMQDWLEKNVGFRRNPLFLLIYSGHVICVSLTCHPTLQLIELMGINRLL